MIQNEMIEQCKELINNADVVLIGAGSGLSTAAGLSYSGKRFADNFPDFIARYSLTDMYSSAFYPFPSQEERWAYFSRHIQLNRYDAAVGKVYSDLLKLVADKDYFVITTNVDAQFEKAGFAADKLFATQGDYGKFQCEKACHDKLYDNKETVSKMVAQQKDCRIPSALIPVCPVCGGKLVAHLRIDGYFVENQDWKVSLKRYQQFLGEAANKKLVMLELGVGFNTPVIIRWPFEQLTTQLPDAKLIRVNKDNVKPSQAIGKGSILIQGDIAEFTDKMTFEITTSQSSVLKVQ